MVALKQLIGRRTAIGPIGLDLGRTCLRVAQVRSSGQRRTVSLLSSLPIKDQSAALTPENPMFDRVARWLRQVGATGRTAVVGLSAPDVELHAMQLPPVSDSIDPAHIRQAARFEVERLMRFDEGAAEIDFWRTPPVKGAASGAIGVAASKATVSTMLALCRDARLDCSRVDAAPCALARFGLAWRGNHAVDEEIWGLLDLGERSSRLILCAGPTPVLARAFDYGGDSWASKIADSLRVSRDTAQHQLRDCGISRVARDRSREGSQNAINVVAEMIYNVLRRDLDAMQQELERSYRYVLTCYAQRRPGPLILTGGGACMPNLAGLFAERLGIEVIVPSLDAENGPVGLDFEPVAHRVRDPIACYACAIGLSIGEGTDD